MNNNKKIGDFGEKLAVKYLIKNGYKILAKNHREFFYEIDIIARHPDETIIFFEVKTRKVKLVNSRDSFMPEDSFGAQKLKKMIKACEIFLARHPECLNEEMGWRMDLIAVAIVEGRSVEVKHYKNL